MARTRKQKLQDRKTDKLKKQHRKELLAKFPKMTDEQIDAQWKLVEAMGLDG